MGEDSSVSLDNLRANWTPSQDQYFIELLLSHVHKGNKNGKVFSRQAWADMIEQFNSKFGFKYDVEVLKNRHKRFRKQYNCIKMIISQKGFQWDGTINTIVADDQTWDECIKVHPHAQPFKRRVVPHYNDLCIIFGHAVADGRFSLSCFDIDFEYEEIALKELDDQTTTTYKGGDDQTSLTCMNPSKIDWSPVMDLFFVELMLDQLRKGNKIGRTFKKKAWVDMTKSFNERFGCHNSKVVLKNRLNVLRRHYSSINVLLGKEGFLWDKKQHKVVADDQVWQKCLRLRHNFRLYRAKSMPFYSGMCVLCCNEDTVGCKSSLEKGSSGKSITDAQPLTNADKGALYISGENNAAKETQPLPNADKGALPISGENNFARETQPLLNANDEALHIGGEKNFAQEKPHANADNDALLHVGKNVSGHQKRLLHKMPSTLKASKKAKYHDEGMAVALKHMAVAVTSLTKKAKKEDYFSIDNVISVLQAIPDLDDDLILDACDFLEDERRARMFLALDAPLRKKWLLRKLRS